MKTVTFTLPTHWASALINGDLTGYEDDNLEAINRFVADVVAEHGSCHCVDVGDDEGFMRWHDAAHYGVLACDAATFTFDVQT